MYDSYQISLYQLSLHHTVDSDFSNRLRAVSLLLYTCTHFHGSGDCCARLHIFYALLSLKGRGRRSIFKDQVAYSSKQQASYRYNACQRNK